MNKSILRIIAAIAAIAGFAVLAYVLVPLISYEVASVKKYPSYGTATIQTEKTPVVVAQDKDYTKASNWFEGGAESQAFSASKISFYTLSIPKLKIQNATVAIGGEDLSQSLIQYPGTALPGKNGNAVIFGHSILPQFYNPKDYISIFSLLPTLKKGDEVAVEYDGISYRYIVETMFEVEPTNIDVLAQDSSDSFLTLVTCVPPGHPLKPKRLVVKARITPTR